MTYLSMPWHHGGDRNEDDHRPDHADDIDLAIVF
jgi:hypothetical protein